MQPQQYPQPFQAPQYPPPQAFQPQPYQPVYPQYPTTPAGYPVAQPMQYGQPAAAPVAPVITGTLDDFFAQAATGSKAWVFMGKPNGTTYQGVIERPITNADIRQQTDNKGVPSFNRDGSPKWVMVVPMLVQPTPEHQDGKATWWVKGQAREELRRAMSAAGVPADQQTPEPGAMITVQKVGERPIPGQNPAYIYAVTYQRPANAGAVPATPAQMPPAPAQPAAAPTMASGAYVGPPQPVYAAPAPPQPVYAPPSAPAYPNPVYAGTPMQMQPGPVQATAPMASYPVPNTAGAQPVYAGQPMQSAAGVAANQLSPGENALFLSLTGGAPAQ